jgi:hypothetical protein
MKSAYSTLMRFNSRGFRKKNIIDFYYNLRMDDFIKWVIGKFHC